MRPTATTADVDDGTAASIRAVFARLEDAFHAADADAFDDQFTRDAVQVNAAGQRMVGWSVIHRFHKERLEGHSAGMQIRLQVESIAVVSRDVAVVNTLQETRMPGGMFRNAGTWVLVERDDAWWISAVQQTNVVEVPGA